jgi:23S rRNA (uracil1939-C5)-methyltransferase
MHKGKVMLGYHEARTHNIIDIDACLVLEPALMEIAKGLKAYLPRILPENRPVDLFLQHVEGQTELVLTGRFGRGGELDLGARQALAEAADALHITRIGWRMKMFEPIEPVLEFGPLTKSFGPLRVNLPYAAFLQPAQIGEETLAQAVTDALDNEKSFMDLFAGNGTFAGALLKYGKVHAVEGEKGCVARLQMTGANGLTAEARDLFEDPMLPEELTRTDCVVLDPPRAGAKAQAEKLAISSVKKVIYVSCNPATFARDVAILVEGGYAFQSLKGIDQFIWSAHIECVGVFVRA